MEHNPEVTTTIVAHVLLANDVSFDHETNSNLEKQIDDAPFASWLKDVNEEFKSGDKKANFDLTKCPDLTQENAKTFVDLVANYPD